MMKAYFISLFFSSLAHTIISVIQLFPFYVFVVLNFLVFQHSTAHQ